ncbi:alpha/beta hydrolase [Streptomyces sp. NBC_01231]|nr:alpha/beta hydrolase [Streptomyces sp. NBC_01231]
MPNPLTTTQVLSVPATDGTPLSVYHDPPVRPRRSSATVVLVHGASVTADLWRLHTRHLNERGLGVLRYDQRAHGHTPRGKAPLTIAQLADDLHQVMTHLQPTGPLVLAGHSLGALVLQELAAARPQLLDRVRGMVLLSPTARGATFLPDHGPRALLLAAGRILTALACGHAPHVVDLLRRALPATHPHTLAPCPEELVGGPPRCRHGVRHTATGDLAALWHSLRDYTPLDLTPLSRLGDRLLLIAGANDRHIPAAHTRQLAAQLPAAGLDVLPRTTHALPISHAPLISARITRLAAEPGQPAAHLLHVPVSPDDFTLAT